MLYNPVEIQSIKIAVSNFEFRGISSKEAILKSIIWLRKNYEIYRDMEYLEKAICHIYAYLELGFAYEDGVQEFQMILEYLGRDAEDIFPLDKWSQRKIKLSKTNVRSLIGRWNPVLHSMKISDVVNDIIKRAEKKEVGVYTYHSGPLISQQEDERLWEYTYKLYVRDDKTIFHDLNRNKYYMLV